LRNESEKCNSEIKDQILKHGGCFSRFSNRVSFELSHAEIDAFGGLYLLNRLAQHIPASEIEFQENWQGKIGNYFYSQVCHESPKAKNSAPQYTHSQQLLQGLLPILKNEGVKVVALPVALEDLATLDTRSMWGNSFCIVSFKVDDLMRLSLQSKNEWALALKERATRVLRILRRRTASNSSGDVLISLIGTLKRLPWCDAKWTPKTFTMIPTPSDSHSANLVFWESGSIQSFSFCSHERGPFKNLIGPVEKYWRQS
jgi:hypothetical protein